MTTQEILEAARAAKQAVALASSRTRQSVLERMADALCAPDSVEAILAANAEDMAAAKGHISDVMLDRLVRVLRHHADTCEEHHGFSHT